MSARNGEVPAGDERALDAHLRERGLTAPRITPGHVDSVIASEHYFTAADGCRATGLLPHHTPMPLDVLTFCVLVLRNGFTVTGESACASPENFDAEVGRAIAKRNARDKIWALEGYLLRERLSDLATGRSPIHSPSDDPDRAWCDPEKPE
ncbi:MAG: Gp49 family protein [Silanimonas sp.]